MTIEVLSGHSLSVSDRLQPESLSLNLSERASSASVVLCDDQPDVEVSQWVRIKEGPGAGIVFRVKSIEKQIERNTRTLQLEHMINSLRDRIMFGEIKSETISGSSANPTARQTVAYILGHQSGWILGNIEYDVSNPYAFNGDDLFSAMETVSGSLDDCLWEYDFSSYPFRLYIRQRSSTVASEMRMDRNIRTLRTQVDRTNMYTRFYPVGKNNLHITGDYVSKNEDLYGVVSKTETDQSLDTEEKLRIWANERLNRHCEPIVTVTISGLDLADATGESLDTFTIGKNCRVPLPEAGTVITERVTKLAYSDTVNQPENVTVTLANELVDVATILKQQQASGGRGGRASAKKAEEDHAWFVDTTDHVGMVAEAVAGEGADQDWSRVASVMVDGEGVHQRVTKTEHEIVEAWSAIEMTESKIYLEVANAKSDTYSKIEQTASYIRAEVNTAKSSIYSTIEQTATNIRAEVANAKSDTFSKIEQTASSIRSEVNGAKSETYSVIQQTASSIRSEVASTKSGVYSTIQQTASSIRSEVASAKSGVYSTIQQTASSIRSEVASAKSDTYSAIEQTASSIRSEVASAKSDTYSTIEQTASSIRSDVASAKSDTYSTIQQTASSIRSDVASAKSDTYSAIEQTASSIRSDVATAKSSIYSSIVQTSTQISMKVGKGEVISSINQTAEEIKISASRISLDGNTVANAIESTAILVDSLETTNGVSVGGSMDCGNIDCTGINTNDGDITCGDVNAGALKGSSLKVGSYSASWKSKSISIPTYGTYRYFLYGSSTSSTSASAAVGMYPVTGYDSSTIYYLGR